MLYRDKAGIKVIILLRRRERELDAPDRNGDAGAKIQEDEPDGAAGRPLQLGAGKSDAAHRAHEDVCERRQPEPELIGAHGRRRRAVGEETALAFLQPVLHFAALTINGLVEEARAGGAGMGRPDGNHRKSAC